MPRRHMRHARHSTHTMTRAQMIAANRRKRAPKPEPEPVTTQAPAEAVSGPEPKRTDRYVGYHIESTDNGWYKLIGPDGEQVGKSQRSHEAAFDLIPGSDDG